MKSASGPMEIILLVDIPQVSWKFELLQQVNHKKNHISSYCMTTIIDKVYLFNVNVN